MLGADVVRRLPVGVMAVCAVIACSRRDPATVDGKPRPADAASVDAVATSDGPHPDAVSVLDASSPDAVSYLDAAHPDAASHPDAAMSPDAAVHMDATAPDAATTSTNVVTCYEEGNPSQTCTLPVHCCFSNYSSYHDGVCTTAACIYGTISCDGPEDCSGGQHCCSHALFASDGSVDGYAMQCQASACGAAPANYELCHIAGPACSNGGTCVTAYLNDNDLPRTLDICQ